MRSLAILVLPFPAALVAQTVTVTAPAPFKARPVPNGPVKVGPAKGTVVVVGGGAMGPEIYKAFIDAAGGPDAIIPDLPNAGGSDTVARHTGRALRPTGSPEREALVTLA